MSCFGLINWPKRGQNRTFLYSRHAFDDLYHSIDVNGDDSIAIDEFIWYCKRRVREISFGISYLLRFFSLELIPVQTIFATFSHYNDFSCSKSLFRHTKVGVDNIAVEEFDLADADGSGELSVWVNLHNFTFQM